MKYKLISKIGNLVIETDNERKKDRLLNLGYELCEEKTDFEKMKVDDIKKYAAEKDIDLSDCKNKSEMIEKIKNSTDE